MRYTSNGCEYVGGTPKIHGVKYANLDLLYKDYYKLLVKCLLGYGIQFIENGISGTIKLENEGFVLYTKPNSIWNNSNDSIEKRLVSADFVLLMFNRECMSKFYDVTNSGKSTNISFDNVDFTNPTTVIKEYLKVGKAAINNSHEQIKNAGYLLNLHSLICKILTYMNPFRIHCETAKKVKELEKPLKDKTLDLDSLSPMEDDLMDNSYRYSGEYDDCPEFYLSLGCFSNFIRYEALKNIYFRKNNGSIPNNLDNKQLVSYCQNDPVVFDEYFELQKMWNEELLYAELDKETNWHFSLKEGIQLVGNNPSISHDGNDDDLAMPADGGYRYGRGGFVS